MQCELDALQLAEAENELVPFDPPTEPIHKVDYRLCAVGSLLTTVLTASTLSVTVWRASGNHAWVWRSKNLVIVSSSFVFAIIWIYVGLWTTGHGYLIVTSWCSES
ncbi:hypothetical protein LINGRAHAP2_LOCUS18319 [Linum grandiflorum]